MIGEEPMANAAAARIRVTGLVQGVFYRASTRDAAIRLGLSGWVRNASDGSVEVFAEGEAETVRKLVDWCRQGPPSAVVREVSVDWSEPVGEQGFSITW
jgi:acylphosphatase